MVRSVVWRGVQVRVKYGEGRREDGEALKAQEEAADCATGRDSVDVLNLWRNCHGEDWRGRERSRRHLLELSPASVDSIYVCI